MTDADAEYESGVARKNDDLLDWWECANCDASGNSGVSCCPNCGGMQIGSRTDDFELPPCWKEDTAVAAALGVERLWLHLDEPGFIGMEDGEVDLVRADIKAGEETDPETRRATAENVRELAESYNDEQFGGEAVAR